MTSRLRYAVSGIVILLALAVATGGWLYRQNPVEPPAAISIQFDWKHGADFAGYYAADRTGHYARRNIEVSFLTGGPSADPFAAVVDGTAQFGTATAHHLLRARAAGQKVKAIACIFRRSPLVFATFADAGITHPRQFADKTIRLASQNLPVLYSMAARFDIAPDRFTVVQTYDLDRFHTGEIDIWGGYVTGVLREVMAAGYQLNFVHPDNFGVHAYHECLFTTDARIALEPDQVARFLDASLSGWAYAVDYPDEVGSMVVAFDPDLEVANEIDHLRAARPLFNTGEDHIGWMKPEIWAGMAETLRESGNLAEPTDATQAYTLRFLMEIYDADR